MDASVANMIRRNVGESNPEFNRCVGIYFDLLRRTLAQYAPRLHKEMVLKGNERGVEFYFKKRRIQGLPRVQDVCLQAIGVYKEAKAKRKLAAVNAVLGR